MPRVSGFSPDDVLVQAGLSRLIGLGLGFLPHEQLLSCQLHEIASTSALSFPSSLSDAPIIDLQENASPSPMSLLMSKLFQPSPTGLAKVDDEVLLEKDEEMEGELSDEVEEAGESEGEEEWPSLGLELLEKDEEVVGEVSVEVEEVGESEVEEEWPSIKSIPGLEAPKPQLAPKKTKSKQHLGSEVDDSLQSSSLE